MDAVTYKLATSQLISSQSALIVNGNVRRFLSNYFDLSLYTGAQRYDQSTVEASICGWRRSLRQLSGLVYYSCQFLFLQWNRKNNALALCFLFHAVVRPVVYLRVFAVDQPDDVGEHAVRASAFILVPTWTPHCGKSIMRRPCDCEVSLLVGTMVLSDVHGDKLYW